METFPALEAVQGLVHGYTGRQEFLDVRVDRGEAVSRLQPHWDRVIPQSLWGAEQVHGAEIAEVEGSGGAIVAGVDGLVAQALGSYLGILVADCAAVAVVDPRRKACGLFHSGKKGTELGIVPRGIGMLVGGGSRLEDLIVQVTPCIRPPLYEVDFAAQIRVDSLEAGVLENRFFDSGVCTGQRVDRYYSYRVERGKTGRMLAFLGFEA